MPTLDDAPTIAPLTAVNLNSTTLATGGTPSPAADKLSKLDLVQIYDVSAQEPKTITIASLASALGLTLA
jgi:hypothetical protein